MKRILKGSWCTDNLLTLWRRPSHQRRRKARPPRGLGELLPQVYEELRQIAAAQMAQESAGHTLQTTALIHEAWIKVSAENHEDEPWQRTEFIRTASLAMRRLLIDHARAKKTVKRGGPDAKRDPFVDSQIAAPVAEDQALAIDAALEELALEDAQAAELVQLRYFGGFSMEESAEALGLSLRTAERHWTYARAYLRQKVEQS